MRNIRYSLLHLSVALVGTLLLAANAAAQDAKIARLLGPGSTSIVINGQSQAAADGMAVPQNAQIVTRNQEAYVEVTPGVVAIVKANSEAVVSALAGHDFGMELRQGTLISEIDKKRLGGRSFAVKTAKGVAAARGTSFTVSTANGFTIATTADAVTFSGPAGTFTIQAGMISITPPGATTIAPPIPLATAAATNPEVVLVMRDAVQAVATVIEQNLGSISAESATDIVSQVIAVAVAAVPTEATSFTSRAVTAVTTSSASTAGTPEAAAVAAGAVTASAVKAAPEQAAQIAGAAAQAAPGQAGVITAVAQQVAPAEAREAIVQQVANSTGQSTTTVQNSANASTEQATSAVSTANSATSNVTPPPAQPGTPSQQTAPEQQTPGQPAPETTAGETVPTPLPEISNPVSPSS